MTRDQLHIAFKIAMDKNSKSIAFGGCPAFLDDEIDYWLNQGLYLEISNKFTGLNTLKTPFEKSVKRIHDLEKLVRTDTNISAIKKPVTNSCEVNNIFDDRRMFFVSALFHFNNDTAVLSLIDHNDANRFKQTYNNTPWIENPVAIIENNKLIIYYDPLSMSSSNYYVDITYVKFPTKVENISIDGSDELPENVWLEVVNRAVELALEDIESKRIQSKHALNEIDE